MRGVHKTALVLLTLLSLCVAVAYSSPRALAAEMAVVNNPNPTDRLNLRDEAKSSSNIVRKYYNGVKVEILSNVNSEWAKVRIGNAEGYMQRKFLATGAAASNVQSAVAFGIVDVTWPQTKLALREHPTDDSGALGSYENGTGVEVLGVSEGWLHARVNGHMGYMRSQWVTQAENLRHAIVSEHVIGVIALRAAPKGNAKLLGEYAASVPMVVLFSFDKADGWTRVRIGDTVGYMQASNLAFNPEPGTPPFSPEWLTVRNKGADSFAHLREKPDTKSSSVMQVFDGTQVEKLGVCGSWTHVRVDRQVGYIMTMFLK